MFFDLEQSEDDHIPNPHNNYCMSDVWRITTSNILEFIEAIEVR